MQLFGKIFGGFAVIILLSALAVILLVTPRVEREAMAQIEASLLSRAQLLRDIARPILERPAGGDADADLQARVQLLGEETQTRLTVIDVDGRVRADSLGRPATMADPHGNRPEIAEARRSGRIGTSTRHSRTTGLDLRYLAIPVYAPPDRLVGYVRTSLPTTWITERRRAIWTRTALGAGIAALLGLGAGALMTRRLTGRMSRMADAATAVAEGRPVIVPPADAKDETGELVRALRRMDEQLKERHETLLRERNELAGVLASMLEGVVAVGPRQRVVQMNDVARAMLHVDADEVIGRHIAEVTRVVEACEILETVIRDNTQETAEIRVLTATSTRVLQLHASPLREAAGGPGGAVLVLHDVTELRRLEAVRRDFVTNVSHELKTPLAAMQGLIETVIDDEDLSVETRTQFLQRSLSQTARLAALVEDLLTLSRLESETSVMERTQLDVRRALREAAERLEPVAKRSDLQVRLDLPSEELFVMGDEEGVRQIADNLLDNAQKYTAPGGCIDLRVHAEGKEAVIEVRDTGIGIEDEHLDRIFERFYRIDKARSRSLGGTGLGLAIVKHLTEAHAGRIEVESTPGKGTCFRVRIPLSEPVETE